MLRVTGAVVGLFGLLAAAGSAALEAQPCAPAIVWEKQLGTGLVHYNFGGLAGLPDGELVLGAWTMPAVNPDVSELGAVFWAATPDGAERELVSLRGPLPGVSTPQGDLALTALFGLASIEGGRLLALGEAGGGVPLVVAVDPFGQRALPSLLALDPQTKFRGVRALPGGAVLGLGQAGEDSLAVAVDPAGGIVRQVRSDLGARDLYFDGLPLDGGRLLLVANSGAIDMLLRGPSRVSVRLIAADGSVEREVAFPGRHGSLARLGDGFVVVYDRRGDESQEIAAARLAADLSLVWEKEVVASSEGFSEFTVQPWGEGGFLVAGAKDWRLYLAAFDAAGTRLWDYWREDDALLANRFAVLATERSFFAASSVFIQESSTSVQQRVRLTRLDCAPPPSGPVTRQAGSETEQPPESGS